MKTFVLKKIQIKMMVLMKEQMEIPMVIVPVVYNNHLMMEHLPLIHRNQMFLT